MFNNPFLKNDPLLEAVKTAQADGETRRAAVAIVNEEFGVYSRNAVIRENLAAYDAAIEEVYAALTEGNKENKEKKKEHEEKTGMEHIKKMGGFPGQSLKRTARELTKEEKADRDYDGDGKIESGKAEYQGSRIAAAKRAGKLEEEPVDYSGSSTVTKSAPKEDPSLPTKYPGAATSAPTAQRLSNAKAAVTPIKEAAYSAKAARAGKDIGKPGKNFAKIAAKAGEKYGSKEKGKKVAGAILAKIRAKHMKEDQSF